MLTGDPLALNRRFLRRSATEEAPIASLDCEDPKTETETVDSQQSDTLAQRGKSGSLSRRLQKSTSWAKKVKDELFTVHEATAADADKELRTLPSRTYSQKDDYVATEPSFIQRLGLFTQRQAHQPLERHRRTGSSWGVESLRLPAILEKGAVQKSEAGLQRDHKRGRRVEAVATGEGEGEAARGNEDMDLRETVGSRDRVGSRDTGSTSSEQDGQGCRKDQGTGCTADDAEEGTLFQNGAGIRQGCAGVGSSTQALGSHVQKHSAFDSSQAVPTGGGHQEQEKHRTPGFGRATQKGTMAGSGEYAEEEQEEVSDIGSFLSRTKCARVPLSVVVRQCNQEWYNDTLEQAKAGDVSMQMLLGQMLLAGYGTLQNTQQGYYWLEQAASQDKDAMQLLSHMREKEGRPPSKASAKMNSETNV